MDSLVKKIGHTLFTAVYCSIGLLQPLYAAPLNISDVPLFLDRDSIPNVFFEVDDSGSMDWEIMARPHYHFCAYDGDAYGYPGNNTCNGVINNGLWRSYTGSSFEYFEYIFDNTDNAYGAPACSSGYNTTLYSCSSGTFDTDWRVRSSSVNVLYYDPAVNYDPWKIEGMSDANFAAARSNPQSGTTGYSLLRDLTGFSYEVWGDGRGYSGSRPERGTNQNATDTSNEEVDLWDKHTRFTFQENGTTGDAEVLMEVVTYAPDSTGLNPTTVTSTLTGTGSHTELGGGAVSSRTIAEAQQNVANWYQYARKRSYVTKGALAAVVDGKPGFRYGLSLLNSYSTVFVQVPASEVTDFTSHNLGLLTAMNQYTWIGQGTPLRKGLERTGKYFDNELSGKDDPIISECQQNFSVLFSDGYWNGGDPGTVTNDEDGDGYSVTVADVAKYYYDKDLSSLPNNVPIIENKDENSKQHMVTFTVAFGVEGRLGDSDNNGLPDTRNGVAITELDSEDDDWGDAKSGSDNPEKIDDLWHAAFNSKGTFVSAKKPTDVVKGLADALAEIDTRVGSAASVAANSTSIQGSTSIYQARFDSEDWSGELANIPISDGNSCTDVYGKKIRKGFPCAENKDVEAGKVLDSRTSARKIYTFNPAADSGDGVGISFAWPDDIENLDDNDLSATQVAALLVGAPETPSNQVYGGNLVNYLRGSQANEGFAEGKFRKRSSILGDIINSAPFFVGKPPYFYPDTMESVTYSSFVTSNSSRTPVVYVGANDGMLHAFNAVNGQELFAYVPSAVYKNLPDLASQSYTHKFYVDGSPTGGDVFYDSAWHTVLVGGLGAGGQGIYALDVTAPDSFTADKVLWEFTDADDADLGYTYSQPDIVKMNNGVWAAIFGNGYNNTTSDGAASTTGDAVLYIVNIKTGALIKKITTKAGTTASPNGLSTVTPVDVDDDRDVDFIYAGDLQGNLWKFDVSGSNSNQWKVAYGSSGSPQPLFTAIAPDGSAQPITSRPSVSTHPQSFKDGYLVYFGTGKYVEKSDTNVLSVPTQTFYGIWDNDSTVPNTRTSGVYTRLLQQTILDQPSRNITNVDGDVIDTVTLRISSDNDIDWDGDESTDPHLGWYMDLLNTGGGNTNNKGEKQVTDSVFRDGRIIFTTLIPSSDPCSGGGSSFLMELDARNGGVLSRPPFDLNNDGDFDDSDTYIKVVDGDSFYLIPSGISDGDGILSTPRIIADGEKETKHMSISTGAVKSWGESVRVGRQSWRQLFR